MKSLIHKLVAVFSGITFLFSSIAISAQSSAPSWVDINMRNLQYPQGSYYTGFSVVSVNSGETQEAAAKRAKQNALGELSDGVRVMVNSKTTSSDTSTRGSDIEEQIYSKFTSLIQTTSQTEVVGSKVNTYYDAPNRLFYAFAYVSREELKRYYQGQISLHLNKVEGALNTAAQLAEKGYKNKARKHCLSVVDAFASIAYAQDLLTAVDVSATDAVLQQSRSERLRNTLVQTITDLENSNYIYLECVENVNGETVAYITDRLPGMITEKGCGCTFTDYKEEADYVVTVNARLARCQDAPNEQVFCYTHATVSVLNTHTQKVVKPRLAEAKGGWTNRNRERATEEAFVNLADQIVEKVVPLLKN